MVSSPSKGALNLPKAVRAMLDAILLHAIPSSATPHRLRQKLTIADTSATNHMFPDCLAFIFYHHSTHIQVRLGNTTFTPVLGTDTAIVSLNGKCVFVCNTLYMPGLRCPLCSLQAHVSQKGCGFMGAESLGGIFVYFHGFVLEVDTSKDCTLSYAPIGKKVSIQDLDYAQPKTSSCSAASNDAHPPTVPVPPARLGSDWREVTFARHNPKQGPPPPTTLPASSTVSGGPLFTDVLKDIKFMSAMTSDEVKEHLHRPGSTPPAVRPCDTPNGSDKKTNWTAEDLHRVTGCRKFKDYRHLLCTTHAGRWVETGEFPLSLGSHATIPKSRCGKSIDPRAYKYLDKVHGDIGFSDTIAIGGACYVLVFVNRATRYNWVFALKTLSKSDIKEAFDLFCAKTGAFAKCFRCDCNPKLFSRSIKTHLTSQQSNIMHTSAGRQSSNGLAESHCKTMVHMSHTYLTKKPRNFWFNLIRHAAQMMNHVPAKYNDRLASPFMLVHGTLADSRTWLPLFSVCYFHTKKVGGIRRSNNRAHTMDGIILGRNSNSNAAIVYNPRNKNF